MREAIDAFVEYMPVVHSPDSEVVLIEGSDTAEFCWQVNTDLGVNDQAHYQAAMLNVKLMQMIGGPAFRLSYVSLSADPQASDLPEMERLLGCRVHPRSARNSLAFPLHALDLPVPTSNRLLYRLLGGYLEKVKTTQRIGTIERVESYIRGALPTGHCSIERCSAKLGVSVRTIDTHLSHIFTKLELTGRSQLAAMVARAERESKVSMR